MSETAAVVDSGTLNVQRKYNLTEALMSETAAVASCGTLKVQQKSLI